MAKGILATFAMVRVIGGEYLGKRESMFEQLDDPKPAGRKSWKERLKHGAIIVIVSAAVTVIVVLACAFIAVSPIP